MIGLQAADIVIIAARVRGIKTSKALELIDIEAAEVALSRANQVTGDPAAAAATMLSALLRRPVLPSGGERVAVLAMAQFLALNGFDVDLDPPEETKDLLAAVAAGGVGAAELGDWLVSRLTIRLPSGHDQRATLRRWLPRRRGKFGRDRYGRFTDRAKTAVTLADEEARRLGRVP